jgi:hypothetical protein
VDGGDEPCVDGVERQLRINNSLTGIEQSRFTRKKIMALSELSKRAAARQRRVAAFSGEGTPPGDKSCELLCEDHVGTYTLPYFCHWSNGTWRSITTGDPVKAGVVGWRVATY